MNRSFSAVSLTIVGTIALSCGHPKGGEQNASESKSSVSRSADIGLPAPVYVSRSISGDPVSFADLRGRPVLVNVWATWCIPCQLEAPVLERLYQRYSPQGLAVVGVSIDDPEHLQTVREFMTAHGVTYSIWLDPKKEILRALVVIGVPATFLISRDGTLLYKHMGPVLDDDWGMHRMIQNSLTH